MKSRHLFVVMIGTALAFALAGTASADTIIAQIGAGYDTSCNLDTTCAAAVLGGAAFSGNLTSDPNNAVYDDPSLFIYNTTGFSFSNVSITGKGYQGYNNGTIQAPTNGVPSSIGANSVFQFSWDDYPGFASCGDGAGNLFAYDYDDTNGCSSSAQPGNTALIFSAHWDNPAYNGGLGVDVTTDPFSPTTNLSGAFFGFEGLDEGGYAESSWDSHSPAPGAYVANIKIGAPQTFATPEPSSLLMLGSGLLCLGGSLKRKFFS